MRKVVEWPGTEPFTYIRPRGSRRLCGAQASGQAPTPLLCGESRTEHRAESLARQSVTRIGHLYRRTAVRARNDTHAQPPTTLHGVDSVFDQTLHDPFEQRRTYQSHSTTRPVVETPLHTARHTSPHIIHRMTRTCTHRGLAEASAWNLSLKTAPRYRPDASRRHRSAPQPPAYRPGRAVSRSTP